MGRLPNIVSSTSFGVPGFESLMTWGTCPPLGAHLVRHGEVRPLKHLATWHDARAQTPRCGNGPDLCLPPPSPPAPTSSARATQGPGLLHPLPSDLPVRCFLPFDLHPAGSRAGFCPRASSPDPGYNPGVTAHAPEGLAWLDSTGPGWGWGHCLQSPAPLSAAATPALPPGNQRPRAEGPAPEARSWL